MKDTLQGINTKLDEAENQISDLEDKVEKKHRQRTKMKKEFKK